MRRVLSVFISSLLFCSMLFIPANVVESKSFDGFVYVVNDDNVEIVSYSGTDENLIIPSEIDNHPVTIIGDEAFKENDSFERVTIPDSVKSIGNRAFRFCQKLKTVSFSTNIKIGWQAFAYCKNLDSISIPDGVVNIGENSFLETGFYNNADNWIDGALYIGNHLIKVKELNSNTFDFKNGTLTIASKAFENLMTLESICIPDTVISINNAAFVNCKCLEDVIIPNSVIDAGNPNGYLFEDCINVKRVKVGQVIENSYLFSKSKNIEEFEVLEGAKTIRDYAFSGFQKLKKILLPDSISSVGENIVYDTEFYNEENNWKNDLLYIGKHLVASKAKGDVVLPEDTLTIAKEVFRLSRIESIIIPDSIEMIEEGQFGSCSNLKRITLPKRLAKIGNNAFEGCTYLEDITIPDSVHSIGDCAFLGCHNLREIVIPKEVEFIGEKALGYSVIGEKLTDFKIYGTKGSIAEKYANENDIEFIDINSMKDTETVPSESQTEEITQPISDKPTEPVETQSTTDEPTEPIETQPVTTEPTEPAVTEPQPTIPEPTTSVVEPTQPITDKPTEPVTTEPQPTIPEPTTPVVEPTQSNTDKPSATVKKANPIKVSVKTKTVKLKKLKKKAQTIKAITIKDAQDKVSCKITKAAKIKKFLKINAKGVITFNKWKKAKKGTYNITVQINAKGNADYKSKKLVKTIKIKVN